ncbi:helix-turn-helix domain-containing protein [Clostridium butyricum]|uniref:helix-turn-helix domain-containing protein n=1 Tax=Clostridium butyricum TaxID=1492 RepID=UPI00346687C0
MINENIKRSREQAGISQRELGRRINKTGQYISYLEKNPNANPSFDVITDIAKALDISISDIIDIKKTLTNKLIQLLDNKIFKDIDSENTQELIYELVNVDTDRLDECIKNNIELPENDLINIAKFILKENPLEFITFFKENYDSISNYNNLLSLYLENKKMLEKYSNDELKNKPALESIEISKLIIELGKNKAKQINCSNILFNALKEYYGSQLYKVDNLKSGQHIVLNINDKIIKYNQKEFYMFFDYMCKEFITFKSTIDLIKNNIDTE